MDINNLKTFLAVAKYGSFRKAAGDFFLSPRAVSKQMDQLEDELGVPLFIRKKNSSQLTDIGREFIVTAEDIVNTYTTEINRISARQKRPNKHLRVGFSSSNQAYAFQKTVLPLIDKDISLDLIQQSGRRLITLLNGNALDIAITPYYFLNKQQPQDKRYQKLKRVNLFQGELVVGVSQNSLLSQKKELEIADLENLNIFYYSPIESSFMQDVLLHKFPHHFSREQIKRSPSLELRDAYVAANQGVAFYPSPFVAVEKTRNPSIVFLPLSAQNNIAYSASLYYSRDAEPFIQELIAKLPTQ